MRKLGDETRETPGNPGTGTCEEIGFGWWRANPRGDFLFACGSITCQPHNETASRCNERFGNSGKLGDRNV